MKSLLLVLLGAGLGVAGLLVFQHPDRASTAIQGGFNRATTAVSEVRRSHCVQEFHHRTACYQKLPAKECDALLVEECGVPE